jgi:hypothetical protein
MAAAPLCDRRHAVSSCWTTVSLSHMEEYVAVCPQSIGIGVKRIFLAGDGEGG